MSLWNRLFPPRKAKPSEPTVRVYQIFVHGHREGFVAARSPQQIADYINVTHRYGEDWYGNGSNEDQRANRNAIVRRRGDQVYRWDNMGATSESDIEVLRRFRVIHDVLPDSDFLNQGTPTYYDLGTMVDSMENDVLVIAVYNESQTHIGFVDRDRIMQKLKAVNESWAEGKAGEAAAHKRAQKLGLVPLPKDNILTEA